jgi:hypothetical protein
MLADSAIKSLGERFYDLEPVSRMNICRRRAVVRDAAFDERLRRSKIDANHTPGFVERVASCICDKFRHHHAQPPAAIGIHPERAIDVHELDAFGVKPGTADCSTQLA